MADADGGTGREPATPAPGKSARKRRSSARSGASTRDSSATTSEPNPLGLERGSFTAGGDEPPPVVTGDALEDYEPPAPEPIEWTPERAGAIFRGAAFVLHAADPLGHEPGGDELWRATESDVDAIGPPLARILNRYAPARRLAGVSDEAELAFGMLAYAKRNLSTRGRLISAKRAAELAEEPPVWTREPPAPEPPAGV